MFFTLKLPGSVKMGSFPNLWHFIIGSTWVERGFSRSDPPGWPVGRWGPPGYTQAQACLCHLQSRQQIPGAGPRVGPRGPHGFDMPKYHPNHVPSVPIMKHHIQTISNNHIQTYPTHIPLYIYYIPIHWFLFHYHHSSIFDHPVGNWGACRPFWSGFFEGSSTPWAG